MVIVENDLRPGQTQITCFMVWRLSPLNQGVLTSRIYGQENSFCNSLYLKISLPLVYEATMNISVISVKLNNKWSIKITILSLWSVAAMCVGSLQPQEEGEAWDVEVPLGSKQLHVHVVIHVRVQLDVFAGLCPRVLFNLSHSICEEQWDYHQINNHHTSTFCHAERNLQTQPPQQHSLLHADNQKKKIFNYHIDWIHSPKKRTIRTIIMVRKPLFQNGEILFHMPSLKMLCHLHKDRYELEYMYLLHHCVQIVCR